MQRCDQCAGKLGLGTVSQPLWERASFFWTTYRFCSVSCRDTYNRERREALARERETLRFYQSKPP